MIITNITVKDILVVIALGMENITRKLIDTCSIPALKIPSSWEHSAPSNRPLSRERNPTAIVSYTRILEISRFGIPSSI